MKALVSVLFFGLLAVTVQGDTFADLFADFNLLYFLLSFFVTLLMIAVSCLKWTVLLRSQGHALPFGHLMRIYFIGYFYTNLLPSSVGGDLVRSYYSGRYMGNQEDAAVCVFLERFTGVLLLLTLVIVCPLIVPGLHLSPLIWIPSLAAGALLSVLLMLYFSRPGSTRLEAAARGGAQWLTRLPMPGGLRTWIGHASDRCIGILVSFGARLHAAAHVIKRRPTTAIWVILTTVLFYGLTWVNILFAFKTFDIAVSLTAVIAVVPTVMLLLMLPISLGNMGLAEGAYVVYFKLMGLDPAASLLMGLFLRFKLIVVGSLGFIVYITLPNRQRLEQWRLTDESGTES